MQRNEIFSQYTPMFRRILLILRSIVKGEKEKQIILILKRVKRNGKFRFN